MANSPVLVTPFGAYELEEEYTVAQKAELTTMLETFAGYLAVRSESNTASAPHPDFDLLHPATASKLSAEVDGMLAVIDSAVEPE